MCEFRTGYVPKLQMHDSLKPNLRDEVEIEYPVCDSGHAEQQYGRACEQRSPKIRLLCLPRNRDAKGDRQDALYSQQSERSLNGSG